ncbi:MAG TPA: hypothetical protein VLJ39_07575 [Tepidisphaeraceae bacterium]|nr:hypothetical protein [Tepidisphaeraceae bacterium]
MVRQAERKFRGLWTIEQCLVHPALDRLAADADAVGPVVGWKNSSATLNGLGPDDDE